MGGEKLRENQSMTEWPDSRHGICPVDHAFRPELSSTLLWAFDFAVRVIVPPLGRTSGQYRTKKGLDGSALFGKLGRSSKHSR